MKVYIIKSAKNNRELEDLVNKAITEGYHPQGGVHNDGSWFHQAMVLVRVSKVEAVKEEQLERELGIDEEAVKN